MNWQPIETAPRDGTIVLVACNLGICTAQYYELSRSWFVTDSEGMIVWIGGDRGEIMRVENPTHWAPIDRPEAA